MSRHTLSLQTVLSLLHWILSLQKIQGSDLKQSSPFHTLHLVQLSTAMVEVFSIEIADDNDDVTLGNSVARLSSPQVILTKLIDNQIKTNDKQQMSLVFMIVD